ncbi:diguanylate cyclase [Ruegeria sp. 2205SS24-7]|uniref:diguanylate cyclase domain-containing protein n=1 Tax=Ruegeria discodermiae TaxID=3064389 RepID=UPI0027422276|nr:diguanylate cyclase [Ruegeria sp. 2205SS24-7]MDP5220241.1 diguanylate cyclase [Ruegeria sp. 2205SS24-7]
MMESQKVSNDEFGWRGLLRQAAFNDTYSPILKKKVVIPVVASPIVVGVFIALITQNTKDELLIEQMLTQWASGVTGRDLFLVALMLGLLFLVDLVVSASRLASARFSAMTGERAAEVDGLKAQMQSQKREHEQVLTEERQAFSEEIALKDQIILDEKAAARIDRTTGVPNELSLHDQMASLIRPGVVLIMVDLVNFGEFNTKYSTGKANLVLKEIAQYMFRNSRRVEHIFRMLEDEKGGRRVIQEDGWTFRLHRRGDEFLIVLNGGELDALGFLNRLRKETQSANSRISKAGAEDILFYAGIFSVIGSISPAECLHYVDQCLATARANPESGRVVWHSGNSYEQMIQEENEPDRAFQFRVGLFKSFETESYWRGKKPLAEREPDSDLEP